MIYCAMDSNQPGNPRRIFITGVSRGLGRAIAARLADAGHEVWGSTRTGESDPELGLAGTVALDLSREESVIAAAATLASEIDSLDTLINCAGIDARAVGGAEDHRGVFDLGAQVLADVMAVNVSGPMVLTRELLPLLQAGSDSMILNVSSQLGSMQVAADKGRDAIYCVSKAGLNMLSVKTASALRPESIGVVMLHPGWVQTDMGGGSAPMTIAESADAIVATLDDLSFADTGRFIRWDGETMPW